MLRACLHHATLHLIYSFSSTFQCCLCYCGEDCVSPLDLTAVCSIRSLYGRSLKAAVYLKMPSVTDSQGTRGSLEWMEGLCEGGVYVPRPYVRVTMFWAMNFDPSPTAANCAARPTAAPCAEVTLKAWCSAVYILLLTTLPFTRQLTLVNLSKGHLALLWYL